LAPTGAPKTPITNSLKSPTAAGTPVAKVYIESPFMVGNNTILNFPGNVTSVE